MILCVSSIKLNCERRKLNYLTNAEFCYNCMKIWFCIYSEIILWNMGQLQFQNLQWKNCKQETFLAFKKGWQTLYKNSGLPNQILHKTIFNWSKVIFGLLRILSKIMIKMERLPYKNFWTYLKKREYLCLKRTWHVM